MAAAGAAERALCGRPGPPKGGPPHREPHAHAPGLGGLHAVSSVGFGVLALYPYYLVDNGGVTVTMLKLSYLGEKSLFN